MKILKYILCVVLACATNSMSAEDSRGFWGWLTDTTSSAWEGAKNTVNSFFGEKPADRKEQEAVPKKAVDEVPQK